MALSNAERQRRYRERKRVEQAKQPAKSVTPRPERNAVTATSDAPELGARGQRLWSELTDGTELRPAERVLAEEACRLADRLDRLDRILRGDEDAWLRLRGISEDGSVVKVVVNGVLAEARQQQIALKQLLAELRQSQGASKQPTGGRKPAGGTGGAGGGAIADLTARIAQRAQSAG